MFFKQAVLKRMLKEAYKRTGLIVGHMAENAEGNQEGYYCSSGYWVIWFLADTMPKEAKAAMIELCGDLPEAGEVFKAREGEGNQYEIEQNEIFNLPEAFKKCRCFFRVTKLSGQQGDTKIRFIQEDGGTNRVTAVKEIFMELIDPAAVDEESGEYPPGDPVALSPDATFICWGNNTCYLLACVRKPEQDNEDEAAFWEFLEGTEIP